MCLNSTISAADNFVIRLRPDARQVAVQDDRVFTGNAGLVGPYLMDGPAPAELKDRFGARKMAEPRGLLGRLERVFRAHRNHDWAEVRLSGRLALDRQRLGSLECLPVAGRRCRKGRERHASMAPIEIDMCVHQTVNAVDNRLETAAFDGQIVLETAGDPDSTHFLEKQNPQASWLHGWNMYRHVQAGQQ